MASELDNIVQISGDNDDVQSVASDLSTDAFKLNFKEDLLDAISNIKSVGFPVFVNGVGDIPLPLGESHAQQIIAQARQAPYGKGSNTIVDTTVRNTWELDPSQFQINAPNWPDRVQHICGLVAQKLGINTAVHAEIYKMLLYEKGAMFKAHTDTEKIPGMFGTLVVSLPSMHTGGEVILKHCGEKIIYASSKYDMSCATWYSDVSHEVLPVTSGYRWVVTYNLAIDQSLPPPSAGLKSSQMRPLRHCLRRWLAQDKQLRKNKYVYHVLDHEYTEANVSFRALKGQDLIRVSALRKICKELPVSVFIALLEKKEMGGVEMDPWLKGRRRHWYDDDDDYDEDNEGYHELTDIFERSFSIKIVRDFLGRAFTNTLKLVEDDFLDGDVFEDIQAEEEYEGYMGNSGPTATHWYRVGTVVIVPNDSIIDYLGNIRSFYESKTSPIQFQIKYLATSCIDPDAKEYLFAALKHFFSRALSENKNPRDMSRLFTDPEIVPLILRAALQQQDLEFFGIVWRLFYRTLSTDFYEWVRDWVIEEMDDHDIALERFEKIKSELSLAVSPDGGFNRQFQSINQLAILPRNLIEDQAPTPEPILEWARSMLRDLLSDDGPTNVTRSDGSAMIDQALYFDDPMLVLTQSVVPIFENRPAAAGFRLNLLSRLREIGVSGTLPRTEVMTLTAYEINNTVDHEVLSLFFASIFDDSTELDDLAIQFVSKVTLQAPQLPRLERCTMWLPLLPVIVFKLDAGGTPFDPPAYRNFFSAIITGTIDGYVGPKPPGTVNYAIAGVYCTCGDCAALNAFLASPTQKSQGFPMSKARRLHMHRQLDGGRVGCTHQTIRTTSPETLVVTKATRPEEIELLRWEERRNDVIAQLNLFQTDRLRTMLGLDFEKVDQLRRGQTVQANFPSRPVVGEKRRIDQTEVIDLTSD
ncbi:hypothetical protein FSARC_6370 [Fusarium sarcochroum]|uniref:Prolyl 4-hydroxylase alpha subunit Fe(2+) 2OG dioxygenase domain-containing protein n=1 Tax=Fusarium sarcochroum TaxID=1208366 RepID=A0A8H4TXA1_9HYPO|nr:hypothetical protein FSARC_6370 [Fusarium sarcochroum]